jgi:hypothetical protein
MNVLRALGLALAAAAIAGPALAADDPFNGNAVLASRDANAPAEETYGVNDYSNYTIFAHSFNPRAGDSTGYQSGSFLYSRTAGDAFLVAEVQLPNGSQALGTELEGCDDSATAGQDMSTWLISCPRPAGTCVLHAGGGTVGQTGCVTNFTAFPAPVIINNETNTYFIQMNLQAATSVNRFRAVRVRYQLRVSPAPATATFTDVPVGHSQHRFVEALVAAGITGGCGGGLYCPDSAVTRGQMAVFLSVALGLHFPH